MNTRTFASAAALALAASPAVAHLDPAQHGSMAAGFTHPIFGVDHVLAMVAVGLWAVMLGGRATLAVPAAFVGAMVVGFGLAMAGLALPMMEPLILASVVAFGLVIAAAVRLPVAAGAAFVGLFALFHGNAHGAELGAATPWGFLAGFVLGTALLHAAGILAGMAFGRLSQDRIARGAGAVVAVAGVGLALAG